MKKVAAKIKNIPAGKKQDNAKPLQIVAIGASAGGLEAITDLLKNLSVDTGMVFIYIPHLSPDHKSILTSILSKSTAMKVQEVTDRVMVKANNFYIIPPGKEMLLLDGHIQLTARTKERVVHLPIDTFFISLAEVHKQDAIGIVLSGSANDGTKGLLAIKAAGGLTFVQDESAKFSSMPLSATTAGAVDFILSPKEIAEELMRISKFDYVKKTNKPIENEIESSNPDLKVILNQLHKQINVDFSHYKMATIKRRILRRMLMNNIKSLKEYALFITAQKEEINILYQDLLINVTNFFRDTDAHNYLKTTLFPKMLKGKTASEKFRIWIPACASGEEAYSIAMGILEIQSEEGTNIPVQIFATDLSIAAIAKARIGEYNKADLDSVSPKRLQQFYTKIGGKFRIAKVLRDMVVFAPHNILQDPPFSRVDFISCCNLFIYLDTVAQKKVLATFYYALKEDGYLMLGKSETIGTSGQLFSALNNKHKIYIRKKNTGNQILPTSLSRMPRAETTSKGSALPTNLKNNNNDNHAWFDKDIDTLLLSKYVPASVVINHSMEILQFRGETDTFLKHPQGKASLNLLKLSPSEVAFELRHCIPIAIKTKEAMRKSAIAVKTVPGVKLISLEIIPLALEWEEPLLLIIFTQPELVETFLQEGKNGKYNLLAKDRKIQKLEDELSASKTEMHSFTQDQEAFIEELQSANEEVVSSNEELQSVNEELETSKEEIESTNEELTTTNQELQTRNELLTESYQYSDAIISNLHESFLVLDKNLRVLTANKSFYKKFNFTPEETEGLLVYEIGNKDWDIPALRVLLEDILPKNTQFRDFEVVHTFPRIGEKIIILNGSRIYQKSKREQLILLSIEDFTEQKKVAQVLKESEERFQTAVSAVEGIVWTNDEKGKMVGEQKGWALLTGQTYEQYQRYGWSDAIHPDDKQATLKAWRNCVKKSIPYVVEHRVKLKDGEWGYFSVKAIPVTKEDGSVREWVGVHTNITKQKLAEEELLNLSKDLEKLVLERTKKLAIANSQLEENNIALQVLNKELQSFSYVASHDLQEPLRKIQTFSNRILESETGLSEKGVTYFERIQNSAQRMQNLIEDLLAFSSVHNLTGRKFLKTDLHTVIEEVKNELSETIESKQATIVVKGQCALNVIQYQFRQVMLNLISNSLKFCSMDKPPVITITCLLVPYNKDKMSDLPPLKEYWQIVVSDNGIGFEEEYKDKIFEIFQRLHDKNDFPGTGIGLAIVKKIIENHYGSITAKSELGKGSTFEIFIPV